MFDNVSMSKHPGKFFLKKHYPFLLSGEKVDERDCVMEIFEYGRDTIFLSYLVVEIWDELYKEIACSILNQLKLHIIVRIGKGDAGIEKMGFMGNSGLSFVWIMHLLLLVCTCQH